MFFLFSFFFFFSFNITFTLMSPLSFVLNYIYFYFFKNTRFILLPALTSHLMDPPHFTIFLLVCSLAIVYLFSFLITRTILFLQILTRWGIRVDM
ncbi:hypothetical protein HOY82DRAFT_545086, partial [Tuber indicum]